MMQRQMQRVQRGFTLIELMIVITIIGILAAVAIPQYQDYVTRSRWSDAISSVGALQTAIGECLQNNGSTMVGNCDSLGALQGTNSASTNFLPAGYPAFTKYGGVTVSQTAGSGTIVLTAATAALATCVVTITPNTANVGNVSWDMTRSGSGCTRSNTGVGT